MSNRYQELLWKCVWGSFDGNERDRGVDAIWTTNRDDLHCYRCLYAYVLPDCKTIIYLGKADRCTAWERWRGAEKAELHRWAD